MFNNTGIEARRRTAASKQGRFTASPEGGVKTFLSSVLAQTEARAADLISWGQSADAERYLYQAERLRKQLRTLNSL